MRKMWEEAANRNKRIEANNNAPDQTTKSPSDINKPRGHPPLGTAAAAARKLQAEKDKPKTEETP